jgi:hypothetical protein
MFALNFDQSEHIMYPGSHVGFPISAKNQNLVYDHPMNISGKFEVVNFQNYVLCPRPPSKMATVSGYSFNIGPYGKNV